MASGRGVAFAERGEEGRPWTELQCPSDLIPNRSYLKVQQFDGRVHSAPPAKGMASSSQSRHRSGRGVRYTTDEIIELLLHAGYLPVPV